MKSFEDKKLDGEELRRTTDDFRRGSAEAFHILYTEYSQRVYRFCLRMLGNKDRAEDAFQETFIKVFENARSFRGENFGAWVFTIARHICLNMIRLQKPYQEINDNTLKLSYINDGDVGLKDSVQRAIMQLPISLREALLLREYEEYSYEEIAQILGIGLSLAKIRVHRARLLLKKLLEPIAKEYYGNR